MAGLFRGVSQEDFDRIKKRGWVMTPTRNLSLMPLDGEVIEHSIGDDAKEMTEEDIEAWVQATCDWYNGSLKSIIGGLNLTTDEENAEGYGDIVVEVQVDCDTAEFAESYIFAKKAKDCRVLRWRKNDGEWNTVKV